MNANPMSISTADLARAVNALALFLAKRDIDSLSRGPLVEALGIERADMLILLGNAIPSTAEIAAQALKSGLARRLMVAGGVGHSTRYLRIAVAAHPVYSDIPTRDRAEAEILRDIMITYLGIDSSDIVVESISDNCGSNAKEALRVVGQHGPLPRSIVLVQDPTMQLRTHASFLHEWASTGTQFISYAPFVPKVVISDHEVDMQQVARSPLSDLSFDPSVPLDAWDIERFISLLVGEIPRLRDDETGYGPKGRGFIAHVDIPPHLLTAWEVVRTCVDCSSRVELAQTRQ